MSEKKKEKEESEGEILDHFYHRHPLSLAVVGRHYGRCYGCRRNIYPKETAYRCREQCWYLILHEECAEMPRKITLSMHPQHTLIQKEIWRIPECALCKKDIVRIGYYCSSSDRCGFQVHVGCAQNIEVVRSSMDHPSHPHQLTQLWRPGRSCSFRCDACGIVQKGSSYICSGCQYWIHESCAALPTTKDFPHLHRHALSLAYHVPPDYVRFDFHCHVCYKDLLPRYWLYHCETCRYVVHIKCATGDISDMISNTTRSGADDEDVNEFPMDNPSDELIGSFVAKRGVTSSSIPNETADGKYTFHNHNHQLHLISSTLHGQEEEEEKVNSDDDDNNDEFHYGNKSQLVCDGCTLPISPPKHEPSSSSYKYFSCSECKYFLHSTCFNLPPHLPSHPLHPEPDHDLTLKTSPKLDLTYCKICGFHNNGLYYDCTKCSFKADVKCASLPNTINHRGHPRHLLKLLNQKETRNENYWERLCGACDRNTYGNVCYTCDICEIMLHASCSLLPAEAANPTWDKHALPLTFDASADHPGDFYCDACEKEMNPKMWMYHCRECDVSLHPKCLTTAAGEFRNIKFRQRYLVAGAHEHPVAYQLMATKLGCDVCGHRKDYGCRGFQCCEDKCGFFMCFTPCGRDRRGEMQAVD